MADETARLLARLPELERLHFEGAQFTGKAREQILERFCGLVTLTFC